ncbi:MAG: TonB-dependent receptor, partial [Rhodothermales bacterium]|nr:TonB-dependent receptor [Rhodothermales bacterium]
AYSAASSVALRGFDLRTRPVDSSQDLLHLAPGLVTAQHAGGGKAEQIFMRGFDADHGTDVALSVDGVPVNMVSHGHGQGYADMHFVIPETVEEMEVQKGPYFAERGNLATAGAVSFRTRDHFNSNLFRLEAGTVSLYRMTSIYQIPLPGEHQGAYFAGQFHTGDGPFDSPQRFRRGNLFAKFHTHLSEAAKLSVTVGGFSSAWDASGQIPERAVRQGVIDRFGAIDDREGGTTGRQDLNLTYEVRGEDNSRLRIQAFTTRYEFKLFSNFTFYLDDPVLGDMIEQTDLRQVRGLSSSYEFNSIVGRALAVTSLGGRYRADDADVNIWKSPDRVRSERLVDSSVNERNLSIWIQEELVFSSAFRAQLGLRGDYFTWNVEDALEGLPSELPHASGYDQQMILSPKANVVVSPTEAVDLFVNFGIGFHSNDARNVVIARRIEDLAQSLERDGAGPETIRQELEARNFDPDQRGEQTLPRAIGAEVGASFHVSDRVIVSTALWWLHLDREYVYVGDGGFTELSGETRRIGIDAESRMRLAAWLWTDLDLTLSQGRYTDAPEGEDIIALAPTLTVAGGLTMQRPSGLRASLRLRHIGDRSANESGTVTAEGFTLVDIVTEVPAGPLLFHASVENVFDIEWNEAQFDTESRLFDEADAVSELHYTPGNPMNFRLGLSYRF